MFSRTATIMHSVTFKCATKFGIVLDRPKHLQTPPRHSFALFTPHNHVDPIDVLVVPLSLCLSTHTDRYFICKVFIHNFSDGRGRGLGRTEPQVHLGLLNYRQIKSHAIFMVICSLYSICLSVCPFSPAVRPQQFGFAKGTRTYVFLLGIFRRFCWLVWHVFSTCLSDLPSTRITSHSIGCS